jgi:ABC-type sugar transport system ATPase subunit
MSDPLLKIIGISKTFPGQKALSDVSFEVKAGEVYSLVGQNGSGKSTLIKILSGFHHADPGGAIFVKGQLVSGGSSRSSSSMHFIHQDLGLIPTLTTVENLSLGHPIETGVLGALRRRTEVKKAQQQLAGLGAEFDVNVPISRLEPAERTLVAVARALEGWEDSEQLLVLDEPTAALHTKEADLLFSAVEKVTSRGAGVIFVSHRLSEVLEISDRVGILRDGALIAEYEAGDIGHEDLVTALAGRKVDDLYATPPPPGSKIVLSTRQLSGRTITGLGFDLYEGEILGVTGILGSGREELPELLFGAGAHRSGTVNLDGRDLPARLSIKAGIRRGLAYVPADRAARGAILTMPLRENVTLPLLRNLWRAGGLDRGRERREVDDWIRRVQVQPPKAERNLAEFSGGNQQKAVLAKWLRTEPKVLLLDEPTQGVDVGAKATIYHLLADVAASGTAILISSAEAKDLAEVCDRVLVLRGGTIAAELSNENLTELRLIRESLTSVAAGQVGGNSHQGGNE